jgi:integrase
MGIGRTRDGVCRLEACTIWVERQLIEQLGGGSAFGPPKSRAGRRIVPFPDILIAELSEHLERFDLDAKALVFTSPMGTPLRHSNFYRRAWTPAAAKVGLPGIHFHDLRHAGNALTAGAGASLRELMDRMGHSSTRAALIYLHSSDERQRMLADAIGQAARAALRKNGTASGTEVARSPGQVP